MEPRLEDVIGDLMELETVQEGGFIIDVKLDDEEKVFGVSLKTEVGEGNLEELVWLEVVENNELSIDVSPEVEDRTEYSQGLWAVLYCISANLKKEEEDVWGDLNISEIAEEIYNSRLQEVDFSEELSKGILQELEGAEEWGDTEGHHKVPEEELPEELILDVEMETLMEMIMEYGEEDSIIVVDFVNKLVELNGLDIQIGVTTVDLETGEESEPEFYLGEELKEEGAVKPIGGREEHGLLEQDYVIMNSTAIIEELLSLQEINKEAITFLNQVIFERIQIEKLIEAIFTEE